MNSLGVDTYKATVIPTLASFQPFRDFAARFDIDIEAWLY
jgi:hypothetical protein